MRDKNDKENIQKYYFNVTREKLYILNTDFNLKQNVIVKYKGKEQEVSLRPTEMISLDF